jgi:hypothetical protein
MFFQELSGTSKTRALPNSLNFEVFPQPPKAVPFPAAGQISTLVISGAARNLLSLGGGKQTSSIIVGPEL